MRAVALLAAVVTAVASSTGCGGAPAARASQHIDSVLPPGVALARFRDGLSRPSGLDGAIQSRDALVEAFVRALEQKDTAALARLMITRAEFVWLYYPTTREASPPYDLSPGLMWFMVESRSREGLLHAVEVRGGRPLGFAGYHCLGSASQEGENTVWGPCLVRRVQAPGDTVEERLFGPILRRHGRFKFVSLANKL